MGKRHLSAERTRTKLMEAAEKLIKARGFDNVTVDEITIEAGVSKGSFYTYFKRKEDIVGELARASFNAVRERAVALDEDVSGRISAFLVESMRYIMGGGLKLAQQWVKCGMEPDLTEDVSGKLAYDTGVIRDLLNAAVQSGELSEGTPVEDFSRYVAAEYYGTLVCWCITDGAADPAALLEGYCANQLRSSLKMYSGDGE